MLCTPIAGGLWGLKLNHGKQSCGWASASLRPLSQNSMSAGREAKPVGFHFGADVVRHVGAAPIAIAGVTCTGYSMRPRATRDGGKGRSNCAMRACVGSLWRRATTVATGGRPLIYHQTPRKPSPPARIVGRDRGGLTRRSRGSSRTSADSILCFANGFWDPMPAGRDQKSPSTWWSGERMMKYLDEVPRALTRLTELRPTPTACSSSPQRHILLFGASETPF
ncbi:hypothetical protein ACVWXM_007453 [Bradyrhizobium sp. GM7.3]